MNGVIYKNNKYTVRAGISGNEKWFMAKDIMDGFRFEHEMHRKRFLCKNLSDNLVIREEVNGIGISGLPLFIHKDGCKILVDKYHSRNKEFAKFLEEKVFTNSKDIESSICVVSNSVAEQTNSDFEKLIETLHLTMENNRDLMEHITEKMQAVYDALDSSTFAETTETKEEPGKAETTERVYYLPADRKKWRVWAVHVVNNLVANFHGSKRKAASLFWNKLYQGVETQFGINLKELMRETESSQESRLKFIDKKNAWMKSLLQNAYDIALKAKVELPKGFEMVKITYPVKQERSA